MYLADARHVLRQRLSALPVHRCLTCSDARSPARPHWWGAETLSSSHRRQARAGRQARGAGRAGALTAKPFDLQGRLWAESKRALARRAASDGRRRQGRHHPPRLLGVNPQGVRVTSFKAPTERELSHDYLWRVHAQHAGPRGDRHLQPLALRGRPRGPNPRARSRAAVAPSLPPHPRVRAAARRRGHVDREGLPAHLARRAAQAAPGAPRRSREAMEVPRRATSTTASLGRLPGGLRGRHHRDQHRYAPWYVVPADRKWARNVAVSTHPRAHTRGDGYPSTRRARRTSTV